MRADLAMKLLPAKKIGSLSFMVLLLTSTVVIISSASPALAEQDPSAGTTTTSSSGSDGVAAASGSNRFVVWMDSSNRYDIFFKRSTDNGATWRPTVNLSNNPGDSMWPDMAVSGSNVYVAWVQHNADYSGHDIFFRHSTDNGATWEFRVKITSSGDIGFSQGAHVATSGSKVHVVWDNAHDSNIYFRRSTDNGATWGPIIKISTHGVNGEARYPEIAASGSNVYVVWSEIECESAICGSFFRRSTDSGATWKPVKNLSNESIEGIRPEIDVSGSNVYVAWDGDGLLFRRSTDNGATWKSIRSLSDDGGDARVAFSGSNVYVLWIEQNPTQQDVFFRRSTDNGATWKPTKNLSNNAGSSVVHQIAISGSNVYVVWHDSTPGDGEILFRHSTDSGATWKSVRNLSNTAEGSYEPEIAASSSGVYVAWEERVSANDDIFFRRSTDSGATWKSVKNLSNNPDTSSINPQIGL